MAHKHKRKNSREPSEKYTPPDLDDEVEQLRPKYKIVLSYLLDQDEVNSLIEASSSVYVEPEGPAPNYNYLTYTQEEVLDLIGCNFHPRKSKKKK